MMAQARAKQRADEKAARAEGRARAESIPEGREPPTAAPPGTPPATSKPAQAGAADAPPAPAPAAAAKKESGPPKKANLQQQIAMKAAAKLKQMKLKKAAAAEPGPHITSI